MKPSSAQLFKNLVSKIHPQVLLTERESKQFLNALTTSFRHQLDVDHPHAPVAASPSKGSSPLTLTEKHVASVLTNPLLAHTSGQPLGTTAARHPIDILEASMANGTASLPTVLQCLAAFQNSVYKYTLAERRKAILHYQPGTKVLQWLWANDLARSKVLEFDQRLYKLVVVFLLRERREDAIHNWIETASIDSNVASVKPKSMLLSSLITHKIQNYRTGIGPALTAFIKAVNRSESHRAEYAYSAGSQLIDMLDVQDGTAEPDRKMIFDFLDSFPRWQGSDLDPQTIKSNRLKLRYAPVNSIDSALQLAQRLELLQAKLSEANYGERIVQFLVSLSDTIQKVGSPAQAKQFVALLRTAETQSSTSEESLLSHNAQGIFALLLQEFDKLDFSPRQLAVPAS